MFSYDVDVISSLSKRTTRKPAGFMQSWNRTSRFKSCLLLIWNFQMRLEMRCSTWNFWYFLKPFETWNFSNFSNPKPNELQVQIKKKFQIRNQKVSNSVCLKLLKCPVGTHHFQKFQISLKSQILILGHVTTVSTNQNTGNSQILWDFMRFPFKEQCCLQLLC